MSTPAREISPFFQSLIKRPVLVAMATISVLLLGLIAASRIPIELLPEGFTGNTLTIFAPWRSANPREVEERIVRPIEEEMRTLEGVTEVRSQSTASAGFVTLSFGGKADMDLAVAEVRDRIERVLPRLPSDIDRVFVRKFDLSEDLPAVMFAVTYPEELLDEAQDLAADAIIPRLEAIDGVAAVTLNGIFPSSIRIFLDEERLRAARIDLGELVERLQTDNIAAPVGDLEEGGLRFIVRVDSRFQGPEEIADYVIRPGLTLGDLGTVEQVRSVSDYVVRMGGQFAFWGQITKETTANTFETCAEIQRVLDHELPADPSLGRFEYATWFNQGELIRNSLTALGMTAAQGGVIALLVLLLFLRRIRYTLLICLSIPLSVMAAVAWLFLSGMSFNLLTIMGVTIAIGMLVDNSIVVVESIFAHRQQGESLDRACATGPSEVGIAVLTATLTTLVVFLPLIFMSTERNTQVTAQTIGVPLCVSLIASLAVALLLVPVISYRFGSREAAAAPTRSRLDRIPQVPVVALFQAANQAILRWTLKNRLWAFLVCGSLLWGGQMIGNGVRKSTSEGDGGTRIQLPFEFSINGSLDFASDEAQYIEDAALPLVEELGARGVLLFFSASGGELSFFYKEKMGQERVDEIQKRVLDAIPERAGVHIHVQGEGRRRRMRQGEGAQGSDGGGWLRFKITGPDSDRCAALALDAAALLLQQPEFLKVGDPREEEEQEIRLTLDRERMQQLGVTSRQVLGTVEWGLRGFQVSRMQTGRGDLPIIIQYEEDLSQKGLDALREFGVFSSTTLQELPLSSLATFERGAAWGSISRTDGRTAVTVQAKPADPHDARANALAARRAFSQLELPRGYAWEESGGYQQFQQDLKELFSALGLAIALVYFLMGVLFESAILPLSVLTTVPFAITGSYVTFAVTGVPMDNLAYVGFIVLAGVVVNNGIVLVARVQQLRSDGLDRDEALLRAAYQRLRPILMTAVTTVAGLLPMAITRGSENGISFQTLAVSLSGGLAIATVFTVWVVPLSYTLFEDLGRALAPRRGIRIGR